MTYILPARALSAAIGDPTESRATFGVEIHQLLIAALRYREDRCIDLVEEVNGVERESNARVIDQSPVVPYEVELLRPTGDTGEAE
jgi:hypothetical protein